MTRTRRTYLLAAAVAAIVSAANGSQGAYFSQSWGWVALAFLVPTTVLLILDRVEAPGRLRIAFAGLMTAFGAWVALSTLWSDGISAPLRETERMVAYVALVLAIALVLRRGDGAGVIAGIVVGVAIVCGYALATRTLPDIFETYDNPALPYRLAAPVGYWNSLGLLAAMGFVVSFGVVAHARRAWPALAAAAAMPLLATTLYFTFSRGAWGAQVFGFAAMVAFDPRRVRLLWVSVVVSGPSLFAVLFASRQFGLTHEDAPPERAVADGRQVAALLVVLAVCTGALAWAARRVARRVRVSPSARKGVNVVLLGGVAVAMIGALVAAGGPVHGAEVLRARFEAPPPADQTDLNARLVSFSGSGRAEQVRIAIDAGRERPLVGEGAGSYEARWYEFRRTEYAIRDAHSLYAETFGELGVVGLVVLCLLLLVPVVGGVTARRSRFVPAAMGAYLAWAAHSSLDWNWELVGVTMVALLAGSTALLASERGLRVPLGPNVRLGLVAGSMALSIAAVVSLVGNQALFAGRDAVADREWKAALGHARKAETLLPWSYEPHVVYGDAAAGLGDRRGAIAAYGRALDRAPNNWRIWFRLAEVSQGAQRVRAYRRVHELNPFQAGLPAYAYRAGR